ncbi:hypothetical protein BWK59_00295 [Flavobacterium davisii]|uniref:Uncharacterized protein n=1 Tax=Flavobacterium davisii TaxID=2906077 RepID=A0A246GLP0_9FLAO|nr:hypothetical protein [Flavobacterium davisii]OWP85329.1 hypothetical protein BWK59_00295 [Flavobacterium davisii]
MTTTNKNSTSETGHAKNIANFGAAIQILQEMGALYNPSNPQLGIANLLEIKQEVEATILGLNTKIPAYKNAVAAREIAMEPVSKLTTRINNFVKSIAISQPDKENIQTLVKKIRGDVKAKKVNPETAETKTISTLQQSFDSRIANLSVLIEQLNIHPEFAPNEEELKAQNLKTLQQQLDALSKNVNTTANALITARMDRNKILYTNPDNALKTIKEVKAYVKSLGEAAQPYYKALVKLQFREQD